MTDTLCDYNLEKIPTQKKKIRRNRSEQYKQAQKFFNDISKQYKKTSQQYKEAETYFQQYEKFKSCTSQEALAEAIGDQYPDVDVELQYGGQPIYYYVISVE